MTAAIYLFLFFAASVAPTGFGKEILPTIATTGIMALSMTCLVSLVLGVPPALYHFIMVYLGLVVFLVKTFVDAQTIYERVSKGKHDVISDALSTFYNIAHIFVRVVTIASEIQNNSKQKRRRNCQSSYHKYR
jgi:FtsH-binding integral membrane protein